MIEANAVVEILLVEDNATDAELCIRAIKKHNLANQLPFSPANNRRRARNSQITTQQI